MERFVVQRFENGRFNNICSLSSFEGALLILRLDWDEMVIERIYDRDLGIYFDVTGERM